MTSNKKPLFKRVNLHTELLDRIEAIISSKKVKDLGYFYRSMPDFIEQAITKQVIEIRNILESNFYTTSRVLHKGKVGEKIK